jgi:transcription initiation factor IIE alpha subunit
VSSTVQREVIAGSRRDYDPVGVPIEVLNDPQLSRKAIRLYAQLLQDRNVPDDELAVRLSCSDRSLRRLFLLLQRQGHLEVVTVRGVECQETRILTGLDRAAVEKAS